MSVSRARATHTVTAVLAVAALLLQTVLVISGDSVLAEQEVPTLLVRLGRLVSYFTIQSNLLVAVTAVQLARDPVRDGRWWRPVRAAALVGITVTGLVHFVLLRPLLHLEGASWVADRMLHVLVPLLAVVGWLVTGPRPRAPWRDASFALLWPLAWLVWTLVVGVLTGWYPLSLPRRRRPGSRLGRGDLRRRHGAAPRPRRGAVLARPANAAGPRPWTSPRPGRDHDHSCMTITAP